MGMDFIAAVPLNQSAPVKQSVALHNLDYFIKCNRLTVVQEKEAAPSSFHRLHQPVPGQDLEDFSRKCRRSFNFPGNFDNAWPPFFPIFKPNEYECPDGIFCTL